MPIRAREAPQGAIGAISRGVLRSRLSYSRVDGPAAAPRDLFLSIPHRIAHLSIDAIDRDDLSEAVQWGDWQYLVLERKEDATYAAIATVTVTGLEDKTPRLGMWSEGPSAAEMELAIRQAESLPQLANGDYELSLLVAPAVNVTALWLRPCSEKSGQDDDLILPIPPTDPALILNAPLSGKGFLAELRRIVEKLPASTETL